MFILITGNVVDGLEFHGPFDTTHLAIEHAERAVDRDVEWVIATLNDKNQPLPMSTYVDLSTGHLTRADARLLEDEAADRAARPPVLVVYSYTEGFWVYVPSTADQLREYLDRAADDGRYSTVLLDLIRLAHEQHARFIRFDSDGPVVPKLPTHEW